MSRSDDPEGSNVDWTLMERRKEKRGRGGGTYGGGMDAWQHSVENRLSDLSAELRALRADMGAQFRWLIGILVGVFLSLLGTMARGFGWF